MRASGNPSMKKPLPKPSQYGFDPIQKCQMAEGWSLSRAPESEGLSEAAAAIRAAGVWPTSGMRLTRDHDW